MEKLIFLTKFSNQNKKLRQNSLNCFPAYFHSKEFICILKLSEALSAMSSDTALMIPYLSKELNLIGHHPLPYTLTKDCKRKNKNKGVEEEYKIVFDSNLMIRSLINVCLDFVKQIKALGTEDNDVLDKVNFENSKLEKQLKSSKSEIEKCKNQLTALKVTNQQLEEKVNNLEKKIKDYKVSQQNIVQKNQTEEDRLKHILKKNETQIFNLHKAIWKQFNLADKNYFPENFKLIQLNQPDFNKLWSTVRHSEAKTREDSLKKAVCIFQNNNRSLMEENFFLKTKLLIALKEIQNTIKDFCDKLKLPGSVLSDIEISDIFMNLKEFDDCTYSKILNKYLTIVRRICELFDKASFIVDDDIFVCWSEIIREF